MKKITRIILILLLAVTPTLQVAGRETEDERFKRTLLEQIREEINTLSPQEIRKIIDEVEKSIVDYLDTYIKNADKLRTKDEVYLEQHRHEVAPRTFSTLQIGSNKSEEQILLEELNPKLKMLSDEDYYYNEETKEIEFTMNKDELFNKGAQLSTFATKWDYLAEGDILINFDNGTSGKHFGHAALMFFKGKRIRDAKTIEAPGPGDVVRVMAYDRWHNEKDDRITYNYVPSVYKTNTPVYAAINATHYAGRWYGISPFLGKGLTMYCTELVFMAYLGQRISLGNGMRYGDFGILFPRDMYCDPKLMYYYRQNVGGGMCA